MLQLQKEEMKEVERLIGVWKKVDEKNLTESFCDRSENAEYPAEVSELITEEETIAESLAGTFGMMFSSFRRNVWQSELSEWLESSITFETENSKLADYVTEFKSGFTDAVDNQVDYFATLGY